MSESDAIGASGGVVARGGAISGGELVQVDSKPPGVLEAEAAHKLRLMAARNARRAAQRVAERDAFAKAIESGLAQRALVGASRFMSRRGLRVLKQLALGGDLGALRVLSDLTKTLALVRVQEQTLAARERERKGEPEVVERITVTWPQEGFKG